MPTIVPESKRLICPDNNDEGWLNLYYVNTGFVIIHTY